MFHAGTARDASNNITAVGGRVLGVCAVGKDVLEAQQNSYKVTDRLNVVNVENTLPVFSLFAASISLHCLPCRLWIQ